MSSLSPLLGNFPTQGLNPGLPHCRRILYQLSHISHTYTYYIPKRYIREASNPEKRIRKIFLRVSTPEIEKFPRILRILISLKKGKEPC